MIEKTLAAVVLAVCLAMLVRMFLRAPHQRRLDAALHKAWQRCRRAAMSLRRKPPPPADPARLAEEAIRRAREGHWEGNVYKPRSFRRPKKPH